MLILLVLWMLDCWSLSECGVCDVDFAHTLDVILLFALVAAGYELLVMHVCWFVISLVTLMASWSEMMLMHIRWMLRYWSR